MPAESQRLRRRISGRDRSFLVLIACAALIGTLAAALVVHRRADPRPDPNCVTTMRASIMGGATYKYCGANAIAGCKAFAAHDSGLAARCVQLGFMRRR